MALLSNLFDVLRGWPREGAIDQTFTPTLSGGASVQLPPGSVVSVQADGTVNLASTPNITTTDAVATWVVLESNEDFSGTFVNAVVCLRKNAVLQLDPSNFSAGSYPPGTKVSFASGLFQVAVANNQIIGEVLVNNVATNGTIVIYYDGGGGTKH